MTNWTWKTVDYSKTEVGDTISDEYGISYIVEIKERSKRTDQISSERRITIGSYHHTFHDKNDVGSGFGVDCYKDGTIYRLHERFEEIKNDPNYVDDGVEYREHSFNEPAVIRCACGGEVVLDMVMTNTCNRCERDYNVSGQLLAPRSQWGEETGESLSDILMSDRSI